MDGDDDDVVVGFTEPMGNLMASLDEDLATYNEIMDSGDRERAAIYLAASVATLRGIAAIQANQITFLTRMVGMLVEAADGR